MQYKYEKVLRDYSDLASGRVFYSSPGTPAFPVRLASEIFQRCLAHRAAIYQETGACTLYDPCCGTAYHLSVLAYLHGAHLREIIASDIDEKAVAFAKRNLGLLSIAGLDRRMQEISSMLDQYHKESHQQALRSAQVIKNKIASFTRAQPLITKVFRASATDGRSMLQKIEPKSVDLVFTDVPYGQHSQWYRSGKQEALNPIRAMLDALIGVLSASSVLAIVSDKQQKMTHERYQRLEQFQVGKRRVVILKPNYRLSHY
jgi:23S rRNA (guanine2535-N1)-methyltransferase